MAAKESPWPKNQTSAAGRRLGAERQPSGSTYRHRLVDAPIDQDHIEGIMGAELTLVRRDLDDVKDVLSMIGAKLDALNERSIRLDSSLPHLATKLDVTEASTKAMDEIRKRPTTSQLVAIITFSATVIGAPFFGTWWSAVKAIFHR